MWETRCFIPSSLAFTLTSAQHQPMLLPGKFFTVSDEHMFQTLLAPLRTVSIEQRTDVYLSLPPPLSHHVGLKLRNEKKAEIKATRCVVRLGDGSAQPSSERSGDIIAAQWVKYADKLKHGFEKRKKLVDFLHSARNEHAEAAAACLEAKGSHRALPVVDVSKQRRKLELMTDDAHMCAIEQTEVRLRLRPTDSEAATPDDESGPPLVASSGRHPDVLLTSVGVESTDRQLVEALGRHWHAWFTEIEGAVAKDKQGEEEVARLRSVSGVLSYPEAVHEFCRLPPVLSPPVPSSVASPARM